MASIIRGTTPTIQFNYNEISVSDITAAVLYIKQDGAIIVSKDLSTATAGENSLSWSLTQEETLKLAPGNKHETKIVCDWKTTSGLRGRSNVLSCTIGEPGKAEVL